MTGEFFLGGEEIAGDGKFDSVSGFPEKDCMADQAARLLCQAQEAGAEIEFINLHHKMEIKTVLAALRA